MSSVHPQHISVSSGFWCGQGSGPYVGLRDRPASRPPSLYLSTCSRLPQSSLISVDPQTWPPLWPRGGNTSTLAFFLLSLSIPSFFSGGWLLGRWSPCKLLFFSRHMNDGSLPLRHCSNIDAASEMPVISPNTKGGHLVSRYVCWTVDHRPPGPSYFLSLVCPCWPEDCLARNNEGPIQRRWTWA